MKISRPKTEKWHNWAEGDCGHPIDNYYKKGFWKKYDRKKFIRNTLKQNEKDEQCRVIEYDSKRD